MSLLQCPRKLWLEQYSPELEDEHIVDHAAIEAQIASRKALQARFRASGGHDIEDERGLRAAVAETADLMTNPGDDLPIFDATFDHDGLTVQIDVLERDGGALRILRARPTASVEEHDLYDCAIQAWALEREGYPGARVAVVLTDPAARRHGRGGQESFVEADVTDAVGPLLERVPDLVDWARTTLGELDEPPYPIGPHCRKPAACPFIEHCSA